MKVSFTGISNVGFIKLKNFEDENETAYAFSAILKDDVYGKDNTKFMQALERSNLKCCKSEINPELAGLYINKISNPDTGKNEYYFKVNGTKVEINKRTLPIFEFFAKLTKTLSSASTKDYVTNKDYIYSDEMRFGLVPECDMQQFFIKNPDEPAYEYIANIITDPKNAKNGSEIVNNAIKEAMTDYFA
ncbi:hypothetical protein IKP85_00670 [bacterium]|nr:hypothetical protein [bacterium]